MRIMLLYYLYEDAGSAQDVHYFVRAAKELGHEIVVYGPPDPKSPFPWSLDVASADAVVFIFEWTQMMRHGDKLDVARILGHVPRSRRLVIDCDGALNARIQVRGDYNHKSDEESAAWIRHAECLSDKLFQPSFRPRRPNVKTYFFHGYSPEWEQPLDLDTRELGMAYVGHSKFRWGPMERVLRAVEKIRADVGRLAIVGHGWDVMPEWAPQMQMESAYYTDKEMLRRLGVEIVPPIPYKEVIGWMSKAVFNPVIYRPLFEELGFVTCRTFETPAAGTIPLFGLGSEYVKEIFGPGAEELVLPDDEPEGKLLDMMKNPLKYADIIHGIRAHMREHHGYEARVKELVRLIEA